MLAEVTEGLSSTPKTLPCKYFYDARGSALFDQICELDEYYPTRTELSILKDSAHEISRSIGPDALVIEPGSGNSRKVRLLLNALQTPVGYVPLDISGEHLVEAARRLGADYEELPIWPVCADFNQQLALPDLSPLDQRGLIFFPGSTIGNFSEPERIALLQRLSQVCKPHVSRLLIGIDLIKDRKRLEQAYDDKQGVTAAFNLNLLSHINRALKVDFAIDQFTHRVLFNQEQSRIEMYLVSNRDQQVEIGGQVFVFRAGEAIHTESAYKFTIESFSETARQANWHLEGSWTDPNELFALLLLRSEPNQNA